MSEPWWITRGKPPAAPDAGAPRLASARPRDLMRVVRDRRPTFTPDWVDPPDGDAGGVLVDLFAGQLSAVVERVNRLPEKARVELLATAGVTPVPARPAAAVVRFTVSPAAGRSVSIPAGFQVAAAGSERVIFETQADLFATPLEVKEVRLEENDTQVPLPELVESNPGTSAQVFAARGRTGAALEIGLAGPEGTAAPAPTLALECGVELSAGLGVVSSSAGPPPPSGASLRWEVRVGNQFAPTGIVADGTAGLTQSGIVVLRPPAGWQATRYPLDDEEDRKAAPPRFWLRVRVADGRFNRPVVLTAIRVNVVPVLAVRTIRDEIPEALEEGRRRFRLRNVPVVPGSVVLEVIRATASEADLSRLPMDEADRAALGTAADRWEERPTLAGAGSDDRWFTVDPQTGVIEFGDGITGAAIPPGARPVRALRYAVGGGASGSVKAGAISQLVSAAPFVLKVTNSAAATGGMDAERVADAVRVGPRRARGRGRAVSAVDYAEAALTAPGASVLRAVAFPHRDPARPGSLVPGVVGVWVSGGLTPLTDGDLRAVAEHLTRLAPVGVRVAVAAARLLPIAVDLRFRADGAADLAAVTARLLDALDQYFDPLTGGEDGSGWPFGGPLRHAAVTRRLFDAVPQLRAVQGLRFVVDGVPFGNCPNVLIGDTELLRPGNHAAAPDSEEDSP